MLIVVFEPSCWTTLEYLFLLLPIIVSFFAAVNVTVCLRFLWQLLLRVGISLVQSPAEVRSVFMLMVVKLL